MVCPPRPWSEPFYLLQPKNTLQVVVSHLYVHLFLLCRPKLWKKKDPTFQKDLLKIILCNAWQLLRDQAFCWWNHGTRLKWEAKRNSFFWWQVLCLLHIPTTTNLPRPVLSFSPGKYVGNFCWILTDDKFLMFIPEY